MMRARTKAIARLVWHRIAQPRITRAAFFAIYVSHVIAGVAILAATPGPVTAILGQPLTLVWAGFLALGGIVGAVSVLPGWNYIERIGITSLSVGIALLSVVIFAGAKSSYSVALFALVFGWLFVFGLRAWDIRDYLVAPPATAAVPSATV